MRFRLISLLTAAVILFSLLMIGLVTAQENIVNEEIGEEVVEISDPALKLELTVEPKQAFPDKSFYVILKIDSQINSDRVNVDWTYAGGYFLIDGSSSDVISVRANKVTEFKKKFTPREIKVVDPNKIYPTNFGVRVNAFVAESNYLSTTNTKADFNAYLEMLPIDSEYQQAKTISTVLNWGLLIGCITLVIAVIVIAIRKFIAYINSPDIET